MNGIEVVHAIEAERAEPGSDLRKELLRKAGHYADHLTVGDADRPVPQMLPKFVISDCGEVEAPAAPPAAGVPTAAAATGRE